jgi:type IV secretory pathway VirJ component
MSSPADYANADAGMRDLLAQADALLVPGKTPPGPARDNLARVTAEAHSVYSNGAVILTDHLARLAETGARLHEAMKLEDPAVRAEEQKAATARAEASQAETARINKRMDEDRAARDKTTAARAAEDKAATDRAMGHRSAPTILPAPEPAKPGLMESIFGPSNKPKK